MRFYREKREKARKRYTMQTTLEQRAQLPNLNLPSVHSPLLPELGEGAGVEGGVRLCEEAQL